MRVYEESLGRHPVQIFMRSTCHWLGLGQDWFPTLPQPAYAALGTCFVSVRRTCFSWLDKYYCAFYHSEVILQDWHTERPNVAVVESISVSQFGQLDKIFLGARAPNFLSAFRCTDTSGSIERDTILWHLHETKPFSKAKERVSEYVHLCSSIPISFHSLISILLNAYLEGPWAQSEASRCFITARVDGQPCWKAKKRRVLGPRGSLWKCCDRMYNVHMNIHVSLQTAYIQRTS